MIAVLTGDVIGSSRVPARRLTRSLESALSLRGMRSSKALGHQIFRGDSFQLAIGRPEAGLAATLYVTCALKLDLPDGARIAVAVGEARLARGGFRGDGPAFRESGRLLDRIKPMRRRILVHTPWPEVNEELAVTCRFLDGLIEQWTPSQAGAILGLLRGRKQEAIAKTEGISQSAVAQRLRRANAAAIKAALARFSDLVNTNISPKLNK